MTNLVDRSIEFLVFRCADRRIEAMRETIDLLDLLFKADSDGHFGGASACFERRGPSAAMEALRGVQVGMIWFS